MTPPTKTDTVVLINTFTVAADNEEAAIAAWENVRDFLMRQPGFIDTTLHLSLAPDARYRLINVAHWQSEAAFGAAIGALSKAGLRPDLPGLQSAPALYRVIRR